MASRGGTGGPPPGAASGEGRSLTGAVGPMGRADGHGMATGGSLRPPVDTAGGPGPSVPPGPARPSPWRGEVRPTRLVYVAHAIDFKGTGEDQSQRVLWELVDAGHATFDPASAWTVPDLSVPNRRLMASLYSVIGCMDGLVAVLDRDCPTVGTVLELEYAKRIGLPTVVVGNVEGSWALAGHGFEVYADENDAVVALTQKMENQ